MSPTFHHVPVLLDAVVEHLQPQPGGRYLDGTVGGGGHAEALLRASSPNGALLGVDRDPAALAAAGARLAPFGDRVHLRRGAFGDLDAVAAGEPPFDGALLDLGVSSPQLDQADRGFSFQKDGPLDMRMDPDQPQTAAALLDALDEEALTRLIGELGEEPHARRIARAILAGRPWARTAPLAAAVATASGWRGGRTHPATRTFQALRMAVNDELGQLSRGLDAAFARLRPGGRLAVISFHSLEDRLVKQRFRAWAGVDGPRDGYGNPATPPVAALVTRKPVHGEDADPQNPRARSATLRVVSRLPLPAA
jgi:16S rRNA (cytosine1402-N4)-methyltransferase